MAAALALNLVAPASQRAQFPGAGARRRRRGPEGLRAAGGARREKASLV
jgi:hypothetical protein